MTYIWELGGETRLIASVQELGGETRLIASVQELGVKMDLNMIADCIPKRKAF
ncbi:hypothetical protein LC653_01775 [Nostoc sp. CHAB 5784]|uniref:hypothetical protein n=1 Tax=Nostoc mirabile TaxID=2907820 RepID=UPI001E378D3D|nr:hypothetical protein [Nostoc mirabile]MCC5662692.1 hypothetical protein [Nostoc mirabile CHAB5784]